MGGYVMAVAATLLLCLCFSSASSFQGPLNLAFSKMAVFDEEECLKTGGRCVDRDDCPEGRLSDTKGLCPEQQKRGVECCHGVGRSVRECRGLGGECTTNPCADRALIQEAADCPLHQACCALLL